MSIRRQDRGPLLAGVWGWIRDVFRGNDSTGTPEHYMTRYSLRRQHESGTNEWRVYVNHFLAPDSEGHHDHPFRWSFSIVLWGSYTEEILEFHKTARCWPDPPWGPIVRTRRVRWFNWIPGDRYHRITALHSGPGARGVWTLFFAGPLRRDPATGAPRGWGFWVPGRGHVPWKQRAAWLRAGGPKIDRTA